MNLLFAIMMGILQGLTEFIPVSSSGHLALAKYFFGIEASNDLSFEIFLHLGSLLAVLIYFRVQIWELVKSLFSWSSTLDSETHRMNRNIVWYLIVATLITGVVYVIFKDPLEAAAQYPLLVAILLMVTGVLIFISDFLKDTAVPSANMGFIKAALIGLAQGVSILPGISRSGATITAALAGKIKRKDAAQFSFLLSIPAILAANLKSVGAILSLETKMLHLYLVGFAFSFVFGYLVIAFLIRLIQGGKLRYFSYYLWILGIVSIIFILV